MISNKYKKWLVFVSILIWTTSENASAQLQCNVGRTAEKGVCVNIFHCEWLIKELKNNPGPNVIHNELIRLLECGKINGKIAVCCSNGKIEDGDARNLNQINISNHPNLGLLPSSECGPIIDNKLLESDKLSLSEMPWMARLEYESSSGLDLHCEGSIINNRYILTSGFCIPKLDWNLKLHSIVLGEHDTQTEVDCETRGTITKCNPPKQEFSIEKTILHESNFQPRFSNDIALIRLSKPITFDQNHIQPICLPTSNETLNYEFQKLLISGWRRDPYGDNTPSKAYYSIQNIGICRKKYIQFRFTDSDKQFCAHEDKFENSCGGTLGSALVHPFNSNGFKYFQLGLLTISKFNCKDSPGIYLKIQKYMDWILNNIEP